MGNSAELFGVQNPSVEVGGEEPNAGMDLGNLPPSEPGSAGDTPQGETQSGQNQQGGKLFLGKFKSEAEALSYLQQVEQDRNSLKEQAGRDALVQSRINPAQVPKDPIAELMAKGADLFDANQLQFLQQLVDARQEAKIAPLHRKMVEDEADVQINEVKRVFPNFMKYYDQVQRLVARPGYGNIRLVDAFALVVPPEERLRARSPEDRRALKREAGSEGGTGLGAYPNRGDDNARGDSQKLLDALGMGSPPQNASQRRFFGVDG